ncbi:DNA-binding transcriptional regulator, MerR family [Lentzea xinjiangensis]|uniref:DNA-binding transcriptional regulator, MerR family n=1 Tax=Lentzea xinjiangensis TaxID=402600 RepID=A0A1H9MQR5_9PSEU|nr:TioE family transcriptional regulator [Lentzea xinjiangensis]SER25988.1 DNA-binding transcriptional regulator, MerR family [Lentzea xinjiangensis]
MRPADLAREHGISTQAVRNYEQSGFIPPAARTESGYRVYTEVHAAALRAFIALIPAFGHARAGQIMNSVHSGRLDDVLVAVDRGHEQLLRDRETLDSVSGAVRDLAGFAPVLEPRTIGELARRLGVTPATLRAWEEAGVLTPSRDAAGHRTFRAEDVRDAELAHLLRRGGYPLARIALVVRQIRTAGGTDSLGAALAEWRRRLTARGLAMLAAAGRLNEYLTAREPVP